MNIKEVKLGNNLEEIGSFAFSDCAEIEELVLPKSLKHIGKHAFDIQKRVIITNKDITIDDLGLGMNTWDVIVQMPVRDIFDMKCYKFLAKYDHIFPGLEERTLEERLSGENLGSYIFTKPGFEVLSYHRDYNKPGKYSGDMECFISLYYDYESKSKPIWKITLDDRVKYICNQAFTKRGSWNMFEFSELEEVIMPDTLIAIGNSSFERCAIEHIVLPTHLEYIGDFAFKETSLKGKITIPHDVSHIGINPFAETKVNEIESEAPNFVVKDQILFTSDYKRIIYCFCTSNVVDLPITVESIDDYAFSNCCIQKIVLPSSVKQIGENAFYGCSNLTEISICRTDEISSGCFHSCKNLVSCVIPDSVRIIKSWAFARCRNLSHITIPNSVTHICGYAFYNCEALNNCEIPSSVIAIENSAFEECKGIKAFEIDIKNKHYMTDEGIIYTKDKLRIVKFPSGKDVNEFSIPGNITDIEGYAFDNCLHLSSIRIPSSIKKICSNAFYKCAELREIHCLIKDLTRVTIEKHAFDYCRVSDCTLFVPIGTGYAYRHHPIFSQFKEIIIEK